MAGLSSFESGLDFEQLGLPISNIKNKQLEAEVQHRKKQIGTRNLQIAEHRERIQAISDHLRNVKQELYHTQVAKV